MTPFDESKPSISTSSWLSVCSRSSCEPSEPPSAPARDQAWRLLLRLLEQLAHARRAESDEHLDELRAAHEEERDVRLTCHGARQQRLAATRRAQEQHALRDPTAQALVLLRRPEELDDLAQLLDRLIDAGHVLERGLHLLAVVDLHAVLAQVQGTPRAAAGHPAEQEEVDQQDGADVDQDVEQQAR
jgi:hypothetical protein